MKALLVCDFQQFTVDMLPKEEAEKIIDNTAKVLEVVRKNSNYIVIHVVVRFRKGHPDISPNHMRFGFFKEKGLVVEGSPEAEEVKRIKNDDEIVVVKKRVSSFTDTDLQTVLRSNNVDAIVLAGITTSGVVLNTSLEAMDLDYSVTILSDCCSDPLPDVHDILVNKFYPGRGMFVVKGEEFVKAL